MEGAVQKKNGKEKNQRRFSLGRSRKKRGSGIQKKSAVYEKKNLLAKFFTGKGFKEK